MTYVSFFSRSDYKLRSLFRNNYLFGATWLFFKKKSYICNSSSETSIVNSKTFVLQHYPVVLYILYNTWCAVREWSCAITGSPSLHTIASQAAHGRGERGISRRKGGMIHLRPTESTSVDYRGVSEERPNNNSGLKKNNKTFFCLLYFKINIFTQNIMSDNEVNRPHSPEESSGDESSSEVTNNGFSHDGEPVNRPRKVGDGSA